MTIEQLEQCALCFFVCLVGTFSEPCSGSENLFCVFRLCVVSFKVHKTGTLLTVVQYVAITLIPLGMFSPHGRVG